jgi:hypothetical protein
MQKRSDAKNGIKKQAPADLKAKDEQKETTPD